MAHPEKEKVVAEFSAYIERSQAIYVADYQGLNVSQISELRAMLRAEGIRMRVAKNSLVKRALEARGLPDLAATLSGPNAFVFGFDDPVVPARIIREFKKKARSEKPVVRGFVVDGAFMPAARFEAVSELPRKDELVARVVGSIQAPLSNFVFTLHGIVREFVGTLEALAEARRAKG
jgi:large subunit ribosomal protein L10